MLTLSINSYYRTDYKPLPRNEVSKLMGYSVKALMLLLPLLFINSFVIAKGKWELKKSSEGIKIFTALVANSDMKALRAEMTTNGTPADLAAILMDISRQKEWVYSTETSYVLKKISDTELIYYTEKIFPGQSLIVTQ